MAGSNRRMKKANKSATKGIKRGWKKGQSASYNPEFNKFRQEAKKRPVFVNTGYSNLTEAKLAEHNKLSCSQECDDDGDLMSIGGDTAISAFTNCTLPTFSRLLTNWNAGSLLHKEMIAVLAAVSEVLKTNGGKETETEYFAALMTTLDAVDTDEGVTAVICLLSMVIKRLNKNILKLHSETFGDRFIELLLKYMNSDHGALLKNLLKIMYHLLKVKSKWSEATCKQLKVLLEFTVHNKPKVRRTAHEIVRSLLVDCIPESLSVHPGCTVVTNFCITKLENKGGLTASKEVFYIMSLLEETLAVFPKLSIKDLCETILRVMTLSNSMVTSSCLKALTGLFVMKCSPENVSRELNARLITALYDYQPNIRESQTLIKWLRLMTDAIVNLKRQDEELCVTHLPKFYGVAVRCWQSDDEEVLNVLDSSLKLLLDQCIEPSGKVFQQYLLKDPVNNPMHKMFHFVEECLGYQYHKSWKYVLMMLTAFFKVMGKHCYTVMLKCLQSLADLHDIYKFPHISEVERAVGTAIEHMGPKVVLQAIPLQLSFNSDSPDFPRSWLLPVLREYVKKTELQFFVRYFMPVAAKVRDKVLSLQQERKIVQSKLYDVICSQIWSLLPGFCDEPTDLKQCFKNVARTLGMLLNEEPALRMTVLSSLRILVNKNLQNEENRVELSKYCKNYLPILFNLYATEAKDKNEERVRLAVYDTCKVFLHITDKELCKTFFEKAVAKLLMPDSSEFLQQSMIDVCRAILPYVDTSQINQIYEFCKPLLQDSNHTTQKKSYSVLNEICSSESESCKLFVKEHLEDIRPLLCGAVSGLRPATRALRLNILSHIVKHFSDKEKDFVISIIPEAVVCTKENSLKARQSAYSLLIVIGNAMLEWQPDNHKGAIEQYLTILQAGFTGSPHLVSATILAIGTVVFEYKDKIDSKLIHLLIKNTCLLLTCKSREIVVSAISFLKTLFTVVDTADLAQHVEFMVQSIASISEESQRHFRFKAKELFTKLIRKFGYEMISKLVPESYQKQLSHIRKMEARKSARKMNIDVDDEDDESELPHKNKASDGFDAILADSDDEMPLETDTEKQKVSKKRRKNVETIIEENEDDIVDLMDPSVNKRLLTKTPQKTVVKKTESGFQISEDGRLIITEDTTKSESKQGDERREILAELSELFKNKKRKHEESDDDDDDLGGSTVTKGIHRILEPNAKRKAFGAEFKAKKAGGDVKKGKLDPYAYVPLNRQFLNKRKQVKVKGQFKSLIKGAKKGAVIGVKRKMRQARRRKNK